MLWHDICLELQLFILEKLLKTSLTIIILTLTVLVVRYGHVRYPYSEIDFDDAKKEEESDK